LTALRGCELRTSTEYIWHRRQLLRLTISDSCLSIIIPFIGFSRTYFIKTQHSDQQLGTKHNMKPIIIFSVIIVFIYSDEVNCNAQVHCKLFTFQFCVILIIILCNPSHLSSSRCKLSSNWNHKLCSRHNMLSRNCREKSTWGEMQKLSEGVWTSKEWMLLHLGWNPIELSSKQRQLIPFLEGDGLENKSMPKIKCMCVCMWCIPLYLLKNSQSAEFLGFPFFELILLCRQSLRWYFCCVTVTVQMLIWRESALWEQVNGSFQFF